MFNTPNAPKPMGALGALATPDDPEQLRKMVESSVAGLGEGPRRRAMAAAAMRPNGSRYFDASFGAAMDAGVAEDQRQSELINRYIPIFQQQAEAKRAAAEAKQAQAMGVLRNTAFASLADPNMTPQTIEAQVGMLVQQGQVPGTLAQSFLGSLPKDPMQLRKSLTQQAIAQSDPLRAVKAPEVEKYGKGEIGYERNPVTGERTKVAEGAKEQSSISEMLTELMSLPPGDPRIPALKAAIDKATTHPPPSSVHVNAEKPLVNSFMSEIGKSAGASRDAAASAKGTLATSARLFDLMDNAKLWSGPGANASLVAGRLAEWGGFGGKDNRERLANTTAAIQTMAQLELDAAAQMKGQGSLTDAERKLLARAASGTIDMSRAEIKTLATISQRTARLRIQNYNKYVEKLKKLPELAGVAELLPIDLDEGTETVNELKFDAQGNLIPDATMPRRK
jgi:hypothetical protein